MQRIEIKHSVKRLVSGGALLALTLAQPALADDTKTEASRAGEQQSAKVRASSTLSGLSREQIKDVQRELSTRGLYQGAIDGVPGAKTEAALKNFQTQQGLAVGGVDAKTRDALGLEWNMESGRAQPSKVSTGTSGSAPMTSTEQQRMRGSDSEPAQKQPVRGTVDSTKPSSEPSPATATSTGTDITALSEAQRKRMQQVLKDEGFYQGEVDGVVGGQTRAALQRYFQRQAQLAAQGRITEGSIEGFDKH